MDLTRVLVDKYEQFMARGDSRIQNHFLMSSPWPTTAIVLSYVMFVNYWGPALMRKRKAFELRNVLLAYNLFLVLYNSIMWFHGGLYGWFGKYSVTCQPVDYSMSVDGVGMANVAYSYFLSKMIELLDTIFFVLRKKDKQITFLHIWHHSFMCITMWWGVKFAPGGHGSFVGFLNSFVHILTYSYYFLAALGPRFRPFLWWKKHLTTIQIVQFVGIFVHAMQLLLRECDYPKFLVFFTLVNSGAFAKLFADFYMKSYRTRKPQIESEISRPHLPLTEASRTANTRGF